MKKKNANSQCRRGIILSLFTAPAFLMPNAECQIQMQAQAADISGRVLYVAENGNDNTGNGSSESPYRSIKKAADEATAGTTVLIRPGTYIRGRHPAEGIRQGRCHDHLPNGKYLRQGTRGTFIMPDYNQRIQAKWKVNGAYVHVSGISLNQDSIALKQYRQAIKNSESKLTQDMMSCMGMNSAAERYIEK